MDVAGAINGPTATGRASLTGPAATPPKVSRYKSPAATGARGTLDFSQGYAYKLDTLASSFLNSTGPIAGRTDGISKTIKDIGNQRDALNRRMADVETRYRAQFTALDTMISSMNSTSNFLTQQLASLSKNN